MTRPARCSDDGLVTEHEISPDERAELERLRAEAAELERLRAETAEPRQSSGERLYRPAIEQAEKLLGSERFRQALTRGAGLSPEDAVELASALLP